MAYRVLNGVVPPYLNQLVPVSSLPGRRRLQSSFTLQLHIPEYHLSTAGRRSFLVAASIFWNTARRRAVCTVYLFLLTTAKDIPIFAYFYCSVDVVLLASQSTK